MLDISNDFGVLGLHCQIVARSYVPIRAEGQHALSEQLNELTLLSL